MAQSLQGPGKGKFSSPSWSTANATERGGEGRAQNGARFGQEQSRGWMFALPVVGLDSEDKDHPVRKRFQNSSAIVFFDAG